MSRRRTLLWIAAAAIVCTVMWQQFGPQSPSAWTDAEIKELQSLSLDALPELPADPSNRVADDARAAAFGHQLFFDQRLSANGAVSCATCHQPERRFTDGLPKGRGIGLSGRNTPSLVGTAYSPWYYWDGRRDSQWAQALSPLEDPAEHGGNRMAYAHFIANDLEYRAAYESLFGTLPELSDETRFPPAAAPISGTPLDDHWQAMSVEDQQTVNLIFSNIGKAIAAYERLLMPGRTRFDEYVATLTNPTVATPDAPLSADELIGLQLFIGKARCTECHNGPLFTNNEFHNTGVLPFPGDLPDRGRIDGLRELQSDPFNCFGPFSDYPDHQCPELTYVRNGIELIAATRTPSLRNLGKTEPYSHKGQQQSLEEVIDLYNRAPLAVIGHNEAEEKLGLSRRERKQLEAFLLALDAPLATPREWLEPPRKN